MLPSVIESERLLLRRPTPDDAARYFEITGDPATNQHNPLGPMPDLATATSVLQTSVTHWQEHGFGPWIIATREQPAIAVGFGGLSWRKYDEALKVNLGSRFAADAWGRGYASELARTALQVGFEQLELQEVFAMVRPGNLPSIRILERVGMQRFGELDDVPGHAKSLVYRATRTDAL